MNFDFADVLLEVLNRRASDLHLTAGSPPMVRVRGRLSPLEGYPTLTPTDTREIVYSIMSNDQRQRLEANWRVDFASQIPARARFRVNAYFQRTAIGAAFRLIPAEITPIDQLGLPPIVHEFVNKPRGFVLFTGPTGSGKSTSLAALVDEINESREDHIMTIEDPIEFLHTHKKCIVNQRELGSDAQSFSMALTAALRQDPHVILVGEMRDLETISTALTAAETGHLVFGTLHTQSAPSTIDRTVDVFAPEQQEQVRIMIANSLQPAVTLALLPTANGVGRVAALEILLPDDAVRNLIRQAKIEQVYSVMQTNTARGMQTMEQALADLAMRRVVTLEEAMSRSSRPDQLEGILERAGFDVAGARAQAEAHAAAPPLRMAGG